MFFLNTVPKAPAKIDELNAKVESTRFICSWFGPARVGGFRNLLEVVDFGTPWNQYHLPLFNRDLGVDEFIHRDRPNFKRKYTPNLKRNNRKRKVTGPDDFKKLNRKVKAYEKRQDENPKKRKFGRITSVTKTIKICGALKKRLLHKNFICGAELTKK